MSTQARVLVLSGDADTQEALAEVARPLGIVLLHAGSSEELASRVRDLHPELVIVDADAGSSRELGPLKLSLQVAPGEPRPQVLLLVRTDDSLREALVAATAADDLIDKPFDHLDMQVRLRALVRVHRLTTQAMRDRDLINALFELTALGEHDTATSTERVLSALAGRVAEWSGLGHVVVTLGPPSQPRVVAEVHRKGGRQKANSLVERRHAELVARGEMLLLGESDGALAGEAPGSLPYVGLPLRSLKGDVLGVLHAWGPADAGQAVRLPTGAHLRVLRVAAERITTEIQLHTNHRLLEEMVEARTSDLTAALDRLRTVNAHLLEASRDTVMRLARAAEYRDGDTGEHVERMSSYAQVIARQMGMSAEDQGLIKLAAPMHDVGKIGIPDAILLKQGKLTADEYAQMKAHPAIGAKILAGSRSKLLQMAETIAVAHHEKWDGTGYPSGHRGEQIPLVGRIVALADVFDALTSPRVYKSAWTVDDAVAHIQRESGKHFDPAVVAAFEDCLDQLLEIRASFTFGTAAA